MHTICLIFHKGLTVKLFHHIYSLQTQVLHGYFFSQVCQWGDTVWKEIEHVDKNMKGHSDDVTAMCFCQPSTLCTGGCDGKVNNTLLNQMKFPNYILNDYNFPLTLTV